jgi:hypothetical protein
MLSIFKSRKRKRARKVSATVVIPFDAVSMNARYTMTILPGSVVSPRETPFGSPRIPKPARHDLRYDQLPDRADAQMVMVPKPLKRPLVG